MGSDVVWQDTTLPSWCWFHISFPVILLHAEHDSTEQGWSSCVETQIWTFHTTLVEKAPSQEVSAHEHRWQQLLGPGRSVHAQMLSLKASPGAAWETHKSWAHSALAWTSRKLQHQNFYWPLRSGQKSQILQAAEKSHISVVTHHFAQTEWLICPDWNAVSWCCSMGSAKQEREH